MRDSTWQVCGWEVATPAEWKLKSPRALKLESFAKIKRHFVLKYKLFVIVSNCLKKVTPAIVLKKR